jgi:hypothetical protein
METPTGPFMHLVTIAEGAKERRNGRLAGVGAWAGESAATEVRT